MKPKSELILYQTEDNRTRIQVRLENETVWLSLSQMAELFQTTKQNVSLHIQNIYAEGELRREATVKEYLTVQKEGRRAVRARSRRPGEESKATQTAEAEEMKRTPFGALFTPALTSCPPAVSRIGFNIH